MRTATQDLDLFRVYLDQAGRHRLLTRQEEIELAKAIEAGGDAAKRRMSSATCAWWCPSPAAAPGPASR